MEKKIKIDKDYGGGLNKNSLRDSINNEIIDLTIKKDVEKLEKNINFNKEKFVKENFKEIENIKENFNLDPFKSKENVNKDLIDNNKDGIPDDKNNTDLSEIIRSRKRKAFDNTKKKSSNKEQDYGRERKILQD